MVRLPHVEISHLVDPDAEVITKLAVMMREARPALKSEISSMKCRPTVLIVDLFGTEALEIGNEFDMMKYVYVPSTAWFLALTVYAPTLDKLVEGEYIEKKEPFQIPGCKPVRPEDVVEPMKDRTNQQYLEYLRMGAEFTMCDGILLNTWEDLEPTTLAALREDEVLSQIVRVPVYLIGPLVRPIEPLTRGKSELLSWLDLQPVESVVYVSFGSGGTLSAEQINELAVGLELSQQRFIWVVHPPTKNEASGNFLSAGSGHDDASSYLPDGYLTRTHDIGRVIPLWAPQAEILRHKSVGGFLSHCGWNSTLESIVNGVPMIAWPLYSEQRLNATMLVEELGVAVRPKELPLKKVVGRKEIEMMIKRVMDKSGNNAIRVKAKKLQQNAVDALREGGSSYNSLSEVGGRIH